MTEHVEKNYVKKRLVVRDDNVCLFPVDLLTAVNYHLPEGTHLCQHYPLDDHPTVVHEPPAIKDKCKQP